MIPEIIILALIMVESSGRDDVFGDHGKAAGCLQIHLCWELKNLQPLWKKDNRSKGNKTMEEWKVCKSKKEGLLL